MRIRKIMKKTRNPAIRYLIGIDEVGRGPLAGPVTVCACLIPADPAFMVEIKFSSRALGIRSLTDSKGLKEKDREAWDALIRSRTKSSAKAGGVGGRIFFSIKSSTARQIDQKGIAVCIRSLIKKCLAELQKKHGIDAAECLVLLDGGLKAPEFFINQETHIKGDAKFPVISFASILAKVHRDGFMKKISGRKTCKISKSRRGHGAAPYARYGFGIHKGYGTAAHRAAIKKYGLSDMHRRTFCGNILAC